ncbi:hypothetical protein AeNC1_002404 [Aphanomyces euteiches]|nr:hypothetical protein AeNC1_002404 [Aphanomyces euteiches]
MRPTTTLLAVVASLAVVSATTAQAATKAGTTVAPSSDAESMYQSRVFARIQMATVNKYTMWTLTTNCEGAQSQANLITASFPKVASERYSTDDYNSLCVRAPNGTIYSAMNFSTSYTDTTVLNTLRGLNPITYLEDLPANTSRIIMQNLGIEWTANDLSINSQYGVSQATLLNLQNNSLTDLSDIIMPSSLATLIVDKNRIFTINNMTAPALTTLSINSNQFKELPAALNTYRLLQRVDANANQLSSLASVNWTNLPTITSLSVASNKIQDIPKQLPPSLQLLNLQSNALVNITANFPSTLTTLCLAGNPIQAIYATTTQFNLLKDLKQPAFNKSTIAPLNCNATNSSVFGAPWPANCSSSSRAQLLYDVYPICIVEESTPSNGTTTSDGISTGAIAGISSGAVVLIALALFCCLRRRHRGPLQWYDEVDNQYYGLVDSSALAHDIRKDDDLKQYFIPAASIERHDVLARGGQGLVHIATVHPSPQCPLIRVSSVVAMKRMLPEKAANVYAVEDFMEEIRLSARLHHRNIVQFVGFTYTRLQNLSSLTEYMERGDLWSLLGREQLVWDVDPSFHTPLKRRMPSSIAGAVASIRSASTTMESEISAVLDEAHVAMLETIRSPSKPVSKLSILSDIVDGLVYLHAHTPPIIHRDLKARNVLLNDEYVAKLTDFGVSRETSDLTMTAEVGTVAWIAPEVLNGVYYSEKADVYSLGVLMTELDTVQVPYSNLELAFSDQDLKDANVVKTRLAMLVVAGDVRPTLSSQCPKILADIATACLSYNPEERPSVLDIQDWLKEIKLQGTLATRRGL